MSRSSQSGRFFARHALSFACSLLTGVAPGPTAVLAASAIEGDQLVETAMQLDRNTQRGGEIYLKDCATCHGPQAMGDRGQMIPALAAQRQAYLIKQLADFTVHERDSADMHSVLRDDLAEPQAWADVAAYLNDLSPQRLPERGDGSALATGETIFREECASCHEADARGDDDGFVPSLRNQHYSYLLRQMQELAGWHRRNIEPGFALFLNTLNYEERKSIADYLSRLQGPTRDRATMRNDGTTGD